MRQPRRRGGPRREERGKEPRAHVVWINGRAYGDFRAWSPWGGRKEPLVPEGRRFGTRCADTAALLFDARLQELRELRRTYPDGHPLDELDRIERYARYHLELLETAPGGESPPRTTSATRATGFRRPLPSSRRAG